MSGHWRDLVCSFLSSADLLVQNSSLPTRKTSRASVPQTAYSILHKVIGFVYLKSVDNETDRPQHFISLFLRRNSKEFVKKKSNSSGARRKRSRQINFRLLDVSISIFFWVLLKELASFVFQVVKL